MKHDENEKKTSKRTTKNKKIPKEIRKGFLQRENSLRAQQGLGIKCVPDRDKCYQ